MLLLHYKSQYCKSYSVSEKLVNRKDIVSKDECVSFQVWVCELLAFAKCIFIRSWVFFFTVPYFRHRNIQVKYRLTFLYLTG